MDWSNYLLELPNTTQIEVQSVQSVLDIELPLLKKEKGTIHSPYSSCSVVVCDVHDKYEDVWVGVLEDDIGFCSWETGREGTTTVALWTAWNEFFHLIKKEIEYQSNSMKEKTQIWDIVGDLGDDLMSV